VVYPTALSQCAVAVAQRRPGRAAPRSREWASERLAATTPRRTARARWTRWPFSKPALRSDPAGSPGVYATATAHCDSDGAPRACCSFGRHAGVSGDEVLATARSRGASIPAGSEGSRRCTTSGTRSWRMSRRRTPPGHGSPRRRGSTGTWKEPPAGRRPEGGGGDLGGPPRHRPPRFPEHLLSRLLSRRLILSKQDRSQESENSENPACAGLSKCAQGDSNSHGPNGPQGPQPCASTNSATGARGPPEYRAAPGALEVVRRPR
jgi:hypothetical protein